MVLDQMATEDRRLHRKLGVELHPTELSRRRIQGGSRQVELSSFLEAALIRSRSAGRRLTGVRAENWLGRSRTPADLLWEVPL